MRETAQDHGSRTRETAEQDRLRLAVIIGSTRNGRFGPTVAAGSPPGPADAETWSST
nr:hypothetical protein GCM10020093_071220 [Planobispora longispora]